MNKEQILLDALNEVGNFTRVSQEFNENQLGVIYAAMDAVKKLHLPVVTKPEADCFGKSDLQYVYENVDTNYQNFEDWYRDYLLPI